MAEREHFGEVARGDEPRAGLRTPREHLQLGIMGDITLVDPRQAGMRLQADLVETVGEEAVFVLQILGEHSEELLRQQLLAHAVPIVERAHRAPAQVHGGEDVGGCPVENLLELVPVVDLLEIEVFDGRSRHHKTVVIVVFERVERLVELHQMVGAHVRGLVGGGLHEVDLDLQRALGDQTQQLRFGLDLLRHEVQDHQLERTHALALRFGLFKREDALGVENVSGRKAAGNLDRHVSYYGADPDMAYSAVFIDGPQRYTKNG